MNFADLHRRAARTYTAAEQAAAWDAYIAQDGYLSTHRGQYAERNAVLLPMAWRLDFSVAQDLFTDLGGAKHTLSFRADFLNFTNLLNNDWGVGQRSWDQRQQPLTNAGGRRPGPGHYRLRVVNNELHEQVAGDDGRPRATSTGSSSA